MKKFGQGLVYYISLPFIYFFSILPWPLLFLFSDFFFIVVYYLLRYRKKVVRQNLQNSFPDKTLKEIISIEFRFYRYFVDMILEMLKLLTISHNQMIDRCKIDSATEILFNDLYQKQKSVILIMGHYGNWEYCPCSIPLQTNYAGFVIYHPLSNPYFDKLMSKMRTQTSCQLYTMTGTLKGMISNRDLITMTAFLGDQTPHPEVAYWTNFLNQDTPVFNGTEKIARKLNFAIVYGNMERIKRGKYLYHTKLITENAADTIEGEITNAHVKLLEETILKKPEYWLWTHRRWKHKRNVNTNN